jgi:hypothetical protein
MKTFEKEFYSKIANYSSWHGIELHYLSREKIDILLGFILHHNIGSHIGNCLKLECDICNELDKIRIYEDSSSD